MRLVSVFLTNGHGVAWNAEPIYQELIGALAAATGSIDAASTVAATGLAVRAHCSRRKNFQPSEPTAEPVKIRIRGTAVFDSLPSRATGSEDWVSLAQVCAERFYQGKVTVSGASGTPSR